MVKEGDGCTSSIIYKLGTPIPMNNGAGAITEVEILAETYGAVENISVAASDMDKTVEILKIASPVGIDGLMTLPGWAQDQITVGDGIALMQDVLPNF